MDSVHRPHRRPAVAALRLVLALLQTDQVPEEVVEAFRSYLEDAVEDYAYVDVDDFLGHMDFLGLLEKKPELMKLDWRADGLPFGWADLVDEVEDEFDMEPVSGVEEWNVGPKEKAAMVQPLTDRPDYGTASGPFGRMAACVAEEEQTAFSMAVLEGLTDEMRKEMDVEPGAEPFEPGANSAVFVNGRGNIVVFSDYDALYRVAEKAQSLKSDTLPEIYDVKKFSVEDEEEGTFSFGESYMYGVEMERLRTLDSGEEKAWEKWQKHVFEPKEGAPEPDPDEKDFVDAMASLKERSERDKVVQTDLWSGNVAWDDKGGLKFIDLEVVNLDDAELAPQLKAASCLASPGPY